MVCVVTFRRCCHDPEARIVLTLPVFLVLAAKPQVLLIGQYSVGKTSFIRYLLGRDFPGQRIGPEPTTDRFTGAYHVQTTTSSLLCLVGLFVVESRSLPIPGSSQCVY